MVLSSPVKFGWLRDFPDSRDLTSESSRIPSKLQAAGQLSVKDMLAKAGVSTTVSAAKLPATKDLRQWCSPIEDQEDIGSCTANAGVGLIEYFERRAFGKHIDASRLFLYKTTRNLLFLEGDTGAYLRSTMAALTLFGVPPEDYYPYITSEFDSEPPAFCYAYAQNYQALSYYRLDTAGTSNSALVTKIKTAVAANLPSVFGFTVFNSYSQAETNGGSFPYPTNSEYIVGGHAVMVVGYDDSKKIKNTFSGGIETTGAFLIRNSWGTGWGNAGYGWLPYRYVSDGFTSDWWSLIKSEWVDGNIFGL